VLECVVNVSEGWDTPALQAITAAAGAQLLDLHRDEHHNRAVLTLAGAGVETAARRVARAAVDRLDLRTHTGVHPRIGVLDVVPFVPLEPSTIDDAMAARDAFAAWAGVALGLPCFLYGPERSLPSVRRQAFHDLSPDAGPPQPHPTAGACAVGARPPLVAYNLWLRDADIDTARDLAAALRNEHVRALGLDVGDHVQVSMNLLSPMEVGPLAVYDAVTTTGTPIARAELVGLLPRAVLEATPSEQWEQLDLDEERTIEGRLDRQAHSDPGSSSG
jgi:glutamate formiminotransferase